MRSSFATLTNDEGVSVRAARVQGFDLAELRFPAGYDQADFEPRAPYLACVLEGRLEKSFRFRSIQLDLACAVTMPAGATHGARFGSLGARIMIVRPSDPSSAAGGCLERLVELRGAGLVWLAWRLADELRASDTAAPLAAEGLALELLAATSRETTRAGRRPGRPPGWLRTAEELLRARIDECVGLTDLGEEVGVHPTHLARVFRTHYGVSVGEYGRRLRLARAATQLAGTDVPLAIIATRAGFADQSHFTRLFRRYAGTTPARYRAATRSTLGTFQAP